MRVLNVGVLALQGGFAEHLASLQRAAARRAEALRGGAESAASGPGSAPGSSSSSPPPPSNLDRPVQFSFIEVRTPEQLALCAALVIPGGESTTLSLVAAQSGLLEPLRDFVKKSKRPTWGTCAGLILLSEEASSTKRGGQELVGGLNVRVHRNHFGRQIESFVTDLKLPFLNTDGACEEPPFPAVFIRAPVVESLLFDMSTLKQVSGETKALPDVEILAVLPGRHANNEKKAILQRDGGLDENVSVPNEGPGDIVALRQGNVFGMSFHPELTEDVRIHMWWLDQVAKAVSQES